MGFIAVHLVNVRVHSLRSAASSAHDVKRNLYRDWLDPMFTTPETGCWGSRDHAEGVDRDDANACLLCCASVQFWSSSFGFESLSLDEVEINNRKKSLNYKSCYYRIESNTLRTATHRNHNSQNQSEFNGNNNRARGWTTTGMMTEITSGISG